VTRDGTILVALLAACDAGKKAPAPAPAPPHSAQPIEAATTTDAAMADATAADAAAQAAAVIPPAVKPPGHNGFLDEPAWPTDSGVLLLAWQVAPDSVPDPHNPDLLRAPVTLEASIGAVTRRIALAPQFGALHPYNQPFCKTDAYPLGKHEVAKITFYEGGAGGYLVRRGPDDVVAVVAWEQSDGACPDAHGEPAGCPRRETAVFRMHVPPLRAIHEVIDEVDERGTVHTLDCSR